MREFVIQMKVSALVKRYRSSEERRLIWPVGTFLQGREGTHVADRLVVSEGSIGESTSVEARPSIGLSGRSAVYGLCRERRREILHGASDTSRCV